MVEKSAVPLIDAPEHLNEKREWGVGGEGGERKKPTRQSENALPSVVCQMVP
jgi:hypothetical protein